MNYCKKVIYKLYNFSNHIFLDVDSKSSVIYTNSLRTHTFAEVIIKRKTIERFTKAFVRKVTEPSVVPKQNEKLKGKKKSETISTHIRIPNNYGQVRNPFGILLSVKEALHTSVGSS